MIAVAGALIIIAGGLVYAAGTIAGVMQPSPRRQEYLVGWTLFVVGFVLIMMESVMNMRG